MRPRRTAGGSGPVYAAVAFVPKPSEPHALVAAVAKALAASTRT